jgi:hypothetical protein
LGNTCAGATAYFALARAGVSVGIFEQRRVSSSFVVRQEVARNFRSPSRLDQVRPYNRDLFSVLHINYPNVALCSSRVCLMPMQHDRPFVATDARGSRFGALVWSLRTTSHAQLCAAWYDLAVRSTRCRFGVRIGKCYKPGGGVPKLPQRDRCSSPRRASRPARSAERCSRPSPS